MTVTYESYLPGALGGLVALQTQTHARDLGYGVGFETKVAADMAEFLGRQQPGRDLFLTAWEDGRLAGGITVDGGEHDPAQRLAHLRWFVVAPAWRGRGIGSHLLGRAVDFARGGGYGRIYLWTVAGLDSARRLYDAAGFVLAEEVMAATWGKTMREQRLVLDLVPA